MLHCVISESTQGTGRAIDRDDLLLRESERGNLREGHIALQERQQAGVRTMHPPVSEFGMCLARASKSPPIRIMGGSGGAPEASSTLSLMVGVMPSASIVTFSIEHHAEDCNSGYRREIFQGCDK